MSLKKVIAVISVSLLVACGGADNDGAKASENVVNTKPSEKMVAGKSAYLRGVPDPCILLSADVAKDILGGKASGLPGNGGFGSAGGRCLYRGLSNQFISVTIDFHSKYIFDSKKMSVVELERKAASLYWPDDGGDKAEEDFGIHSFVFSKADRTALVILTGIGGTAVLSERIVSEVVLTYSIEDKKRPHDARLEGLKALATVQLADLYELAQTTHGIK